MAQRDLKVGDIIHCQGITVTIKEIAWQEPWSMRIHTIDIPINS